MVRIPPLSDFDSLSQAEQVELVQDLWDRIAQRSDPFPLTDAQRDELDRRLAEHDANPDDVIPWEQVREQVRGR